MHAEDADSKRISVGRGAIGVLRRGREYLMVRRAAAVARGGFWCFPGGHVELGETSRRAVRRELREELGIEVAPVRRLGTVRVLPARYVLVAWLVDQLGGVLSAAPSEICGWRWVELEDISRVQPGLPSNQAVAEMLRRVE